MSIFLGAIYRRLTLLSNEASIRTLHQMRFEKFLYMHLPAQKLFAGIWDSFSIFLSFAEHDQTSQIRFVSYFLLFAIGKFQVIVQYDISQHRFQLVRGKESPGTINIEYEKEIDQYKF